MMIYFKCKVWIFNATIITKLINTETGANECFSRHFPRVLNIAEVEIFTFSLRSHFSFSFYSVDYICFIPPRILRRFISPSSSNFLSTAVSQSCYCHLTNLSHAPVSSRLYSAKLKFNRRISTDLDKI